jgi:ABC-type transporter Mla maintaining outer membrane lipid asymmetry permease subunit MlaE
VGFGATLLSDSFWWIARGRSYGQVVRATPVLAEMMAIGIRALPIVTLLSATIGLMLALQGIYSLRQFGAEQQVVLGVALGITREFAPLITGILVAGRSGSALAARLGTMTISNEIDALRFEMAAEPWLVDKLATFGTGADDQEDADPCGQLGAWLPNGNLPAACTASV